MWGVRSPAKFPKEQFTVMDEYTVAVKFRLGECVCVGDGGMLSDSREHLSCLEFSFLSPTRVITGEGAFLLEFAGVNTGYLLSESFRIVLRHLPHIS